MISKKPSHSLYIDGPSNDVNNGNVVSFDHVDHVATYTTLNGSELWLTTGFTQTFMSMRRNTELAILIQNQLTRVILISLPLIIIHNCQHNKLVLIARRERKSLLIRCGHKRPIGARNQSSSNRKTNAYLQNTRKYQ